MSYARYESLAGAHVFITGGGQGIGAAAVRLFCEQQASVTALDANSEALASVADACQRDFDNRPHCEVVDLRHIDALRAVVAQREQSLGPFSVLVNNAGNDDRVALSDLTPEMWDDFQMVNLRHQAFAAQAVAPGMTANGGGSIVNMGSISWMMGAPGLPAYTSAKAAVGGLTKSLARELGTDNIRVNCIAPGWIQTERQVRLRSTPEKRQAYLDRQCIKELLDPEDVARLMLWLSANDSRRVTGQTFIVDGGVV